jgi:hypothetical protein
MLSTLSRLCRCALALALMAPSGCLFDHRARAEKSTLLKRPRLAPHSVVMEVFAVHFRRDDHELYRAIWQEVDEQTLPPDIRRRLGENGFRAGVVAGHLPQSVQRILELHSRPTPEQDPEAAQVNVVTFDGRPTVRIQQMQLPARRRGEIAASSVHPFAAPLIYEDGQLRGETFEQCQGMIALKAIPDNDGRVRLEVVPELHYGEPQRRFTSSEGVLNLETGRPRKTFANLTHELTLASGDLYVLGSSHAKQGSLGDYFFTADSGNPSSGTSPESASSGGTSHSKLVFVRLAYTQNDGLFAPAMRAQAEAAPAAKAASFEAGDSSEAAAGSDDGR